MATWKGLGSQLVLNSTKIAQVTSLTPPQIEIGTVETTDLDATWRTHIATIGDGGTVSASVNYDPTTATHQNLTDLLTTPTTKAWKVTLSDTDLFFAFGGILTNFSPGAVTVDGLHTADVSIRVTGTVTMPATAA